VFEDSSSGQSSEEEEMRVRYTTPNYASTDLEQSAVQHGDNESAVGAELRFHANGNGVPFLRSGFSYPEPWGIWTVEPRATMTVPIAKPGKLSLWLRFQTFARPASAPAGFVLKISGRRVGAFSIPHAKWDDIFERSFEIPDYLVHGKTLEIELQIVNGPTKEELRPGRRPIGIGLHRMQLSR
jgi:hypothetical protein